MPLQELRAREKPRRGNATVRNNGLVAVTAPIGGLNYRDTFTTMPPNDATVLRNVICRANGVELRGGWKEYATGIADGTVKEINCVAPFHGAKTSEDKLFAFCGSKIFDVTDGPADPAPMATTGAAGSEWKTIQFLNFGGSYLCAVNNGGGYWTYDKVNGWVNRTSLLTGGPSNSSAITSIGVWKKRLWFTFDGDSRAYYLPIENIQGALSPFDFGPQMRHGGALVGIDTFTLDGGVSIEDYLVAFGAQGDVVVYAGYDPADANNFRLVGSWKIGRFPRRPEFWTKYGSDIYVICEQGIVPLSMLIGGRWTDSVINNPVTGKIQNALNASVSATLSSLAGAWQILVVPGIDVLMLKAPVSTSGIYTQWAMNNATGAWSTFEGIPIHYATVWRGKFVFSTNDGRVCFGLSADESRDAMPRTGTGGALIEGNIQGAFLDYGSPGNLKSFQLARTIFLSEDAPAVSVRMNTQFNFEGIPGSPQYAPPSSAQWDISFWDMARWAGSLNTFEAWSGLAGIGYYGALRVAMRGSPGTLYTNALVNAQVGGPM